MHARQMPYSSLKWKQNISSCAESSVGFVYWPVQWVTEQTVPRLGSSYGQGCCFLLLLKTFPRQPHVPLTLQRRPAKLDDSPQRADCWTEAGAAYLWGEEEASSNLKVSDLKSCQIKLLLLGILNNTSWITKHIVLTKICWFTWD